MLARYSGLVFIIILILVVVAVALAYKYYDLLKKFKDLELTFKDFKENKVQKMAKELVSRRFKEAEQEAKELRDAAKKFYQKVKAQYETQLKELSKREQFLNQRSRELDKLEESLLKKDSELSKMRKELLAKLEKIAGLTREEARKVFEKEFQKELLKYKADKIREIEQKIKHDADSIAQKILVDAMQSAAIDFVDEVTVSRVHIDNEEAKGKIIGRDGRNIRAFEKATGVDVIVDEAPNYIGLSSFDPVRREVARIALENLLKDGRIHPGAIEEAVNKAKKQVATELEKTGKELADKIGWYDIPKELVQILGRMKYRRSKGQSLYQHTLEVVKIAEYIARELNLDVDLVKKAALLHDIGKVFTSKINKPHHHISGDIARKYGLDPKLVNAIEAHHGDIEPKSLEAYVITIADSISGARPGAREESLDSYVERVEALEELAYKIAGDKAEDIYALKAGRELRVMVKPSEITDEEAVVLARDIAKQIEESGVFPGEVNVVVIKELRAHAKAAKKTRR